MVKVSIKSDKVTPFGGVFSVMDAFSSVLGSTIDNSLGIRCKSYGYQYSEILRTLACVYFCGGSCVEDVTGHLVPHLSLHPNLRVCSSDTILRAICELSEDNITYTSDKGKTYAFNAAERMNNLLLDCLLASGQLVKGKSYDMDFDHQFIETEKYDSKNTYKHFKGYGPGIAAIGDFIVGIENRDGNANVRFHQADTLKRIFSRIEAKGMRINRARMDCGSCSREIVETIEKHCGKFYIRANRCSSLYDSIFALRGWKQVVINDIEFELNSIFVEKWEGKAYRLVIQRQRRTDPQCDLWEGEYTYRCILTNDYESDVEDVVDFYNRRGATERIFDDMNNGFGWNRLPKSFMNQNAVFLIMTAIIRNFYRKLMDSWNVEEFGLKPTSRIKAFVFRYVSVAAKWIKAARRHVLNIYTDNKAYEYTFGFS